MLSFETIIWALGLTLLAGMSTGIGALVAFFTRSTNKKLLAGALGLSAGVMLYVSFVELMPTALNDIAKTFPEKYGNIYVTLVFFGGIMLIALIDFLIPENENPHEIQHMESISEAAAHMAPSGVSILKLKRTGLMLALAISIHNFPEGVATFVSALNGLDVALPIVIAIAIHNIPEGIAVSMPIYHATGNKRKAFWMALLSGLAEPLGALFGLLFIMPFWTPAVSSLLLSAVSGIMVYISIDELLPSAEGYGYHHVAIAGVILGMAIMAGSLLLF